MKGQTYIILALIFALVIAVFAVINVDPVQVNYLFGTGEAPLILIIIISVLMGVLVTALAGAVRLFKLQRENRSLKHQLKKSTSIDMQTEEFDQSHTDASLGKEVQSEDSDSKEK
ncbi:LapA family protein [Halobacillus hunanensis]|uniref:LapA family protein n=1 Tax=Halobacillus hunanensis TaxID=578214 RepID=UPI0009A619AB|nr:lipopolysaccharide assembly protein LapA domain-containing protein [Halobacillus hunanensis]